MELGERRGEMQKLIMNNARVGVHCFRRGEGEEERKGEALSGDSFASLRRERKS